VLNYLIVVLEIVAFLTDFLGGNCCPVPPPFSLEKPFPPSQFKKSNEMTYIPLQIGKHYWSVSSGYILPLFAKRDKKA